MGADHYDAFGNILEGGDTVDNPYRYAGYRYDEETKLYYLTARFYNAKIARFMQEDSYLGDISDPLSLNLYTYCFNNPIIYYDPTGHVVTQADIDDAYNNNPPEVAEQIIAEIMAATDDYNNAKTDAERAAAHARAGAARGRTTNANGSSSRSGGNTYVYLANPNTAVANLIDKENSNVEFSGGGTGDSSIAYDSVFGGTVVLRENVDYYIIDGVAYLYNSVDTRMVVDMAAYRKGTGDIGARNDFINTLKASGIAQFLPNTINSQMVYSNSAVGAAYYVYLDRTTSFGDVYNGKDGRQHFTDFKKYGAPPPVQNNMSEFVRIALGQEDTKETGDNMTKYGEWYGYNGVAWCAIFVSWCANQAGISSYIFEPTASAEALRQQYVKNGTYYDSGIYTPKEGDIFFLDKEPNDVANHVAIVVAYDPSTGTVYTVGGNDGPNTDRVYIDHFNINDSKIQGYGSNGSQSFGNIPR